MRLLAFLLLFVACPALASSGVLVTRTAGAVEKVCPADGFTTPTIALGTSVPYWFFTVHGGEEVWLCQAETCETGGTPYVHGTQIKLAATGTWSCRSATGVGVATFTPTSL